VYPSQTLEFRDGFPLSQNKTHGIHHGSELIHAPVLVQNPTAVQTPSTLSQSLRSPFVTIFLSQFTLQPLTWELAHFTVKVLRFRSGEKERQKPGAMERRLPCIGVAPAQPLNEYFS
jgi:hypothetical protein